MANPDMAGTAINLGTLADAHAFHEPVDIVGCQPDVLRRWLQTMLLIRIAEEVIGEAVTSGQVHTPCHLGIGQEAIAVGIADHLRASDRAFGAHRSHSHFLAMGGDVYSLFAEVLGKADGCSRGMGGSMHLYGGDFGFMGSVPIVAGTVPLAVGAALAAKKDGRGDIAVAVFGDGAAEEGVVQESLNFAANFKLPVLFLCENNLFSSHLHISLRQPGNAISRYADANLIPRRIVDGNDIVAVSRAAAELIGQARSGGGPVFLEAVTYRWRGHVGSREDVDVGVDRKDDLALWKGRDPIRRLQEAMVAAGMLGVNEFDEVTRNLRGQLTETWARAGMAPYPPLSALLDCVYSGGERT